MGNPVLFICGKTDLTADLVLLELRKRGIKVIRLNVEDFPHSLRISSQLTPNHKSWLVDFSGSINKSLSQVKIKSVYYRPHNNPRPSSKIKNSQERNLVIEQSQLVIEWLEDMFKCFWLNSPRAIAKARSKALQLSIAASIGFQSPDTIITNNPKSARDFYRKHKGNIISKLLQATPATRELPGFIFTRRLTREDMRLINQVKYSPVLFQEYIEKKYEIRATVVGRKVFAAKIDSQAMVNTVNDWRQYEFGKPPPHKSIRLPMEIEDRLIRINERLSIKFGAYDLIYTPRGEYVFLEVNANGQWGWIQELTGLPISSAIADILTSRGEL